MSGHYAGFWIRVCANFLDGLILAIPSFFINYIAYAIAGPKDIAFLEYLSDPNTPIWSNHQTVGLILATIVGVMYYGYMTSKYQATLGKMILGLKVVGLDEQPISFGRAVGRYFAYNLSGLIFYIGYIMVAFDNQKQGLHDKICKTYVVYK